MKRVLVSGGTGFMGSHFCTRMIEEGNYVICLDNFLLDVEEMLGIC